MAYFKSQYQPEILDQAIELADSNTATGKQLLKAKRAYLTGNDFAVRQALYKAFDSLPTQQKKLLLAPNQKKIIEDQISKLFQINNADFDQVVLKKVDKLANKSYNHLQTGGSIISYRYLLEALDLANLPLSKELIRGLVAKSKQNPKSKSKSQFNKHQHGGSPTLLISGGGVGLVILGLIIYWFRRPRAMPGASDFSGAPANLSRPVGRPMGENIYGKTLSAQEVEQSLRSVLDPGGRTAQYGFLGPESSPYGQAPAKAQRGRPGGPAIPLPIATDVGDKYVAPAGIYGAMPAQPKGSQYAIAQPFGAVSRIVPGEAGIYQNITQ